MLNFARSHLRPWVRPVAQWAPIGVRGPQDIVKATFEAGEVMSDVTWNYTVASLDPLTMAIGGAEAATGRLVYRDVKTGAVLGWLQLFKTGSAEGVGLFGVESGDHRCLDWPLRPWNRRLQGRAQQGQREKPTSFTMSPKQVEQLMIAYLAPRPVVLVSVAGPGHSNLFPMDLIGPIEGGRFALALRMSSSSTEVMRAQRRIVLSDPAASLKDAVYGLGKHHGKPMMSWADLPFAMTTTERFGMPAVADALRIRELEIDHSQVIGSHRFFIARVVSEQVRATGPQLHHTSGFHDHYRRRRGMALMTV